MIETLQRNVRLAPFSWWKIGGPADFFAEVQDRPHLESLVWCLRDQAIPFCIIGQGTNLLFDDAGYRGCIIRIGNGLSRIEIKDDLINVEAGCWVPHLALAAARRELSGLEHTIGIPASLGGLICMNGGSQRKNIGSLVESVTVLKPSGELRTDLADECQFAYRQSRYHGSGDIILSATLRLNLRREYPKQRAEMLNILRERNRKFPRKMPSCGSVFKSSPELYEAYGPPGKIIEDLGFKGRKLGNMQVSPAHANFIVNLGGGLSGEVIALVREIHTAVFAETGISMAPEFLYVDPSDGSSKFL